MLCALTVRRLKPGTFEEFRSKFWRQDEEPPDKWTAFHMLRNTENPDEVVTFGYYDGTREELDANQEELGYREVVDSVEPLVESVLASGIYEIEVAVESTAAQT